MWVYNAGPDDAASCTVSVRTDPKAEFKQVATLSTVAATQTLKVPDELPHEANAEFRVDCVGERADARTNNSYLLE